MVPATRMPTFFFSDDEPYPDLYISEAESLSEDARGGLYRRDPDMLVARVPVAVRPPENGAAEAQQAGEGIVIERW
jgi:hypothetical protein